jgi:hypothetical protein
VKGKLIDKEPPQAFRQAGVNLLQRRGMVRITISGKAVFLRSARIVTRVSGRKAHLSRYLVGICTETGHLFEVFLEAISGIREQLFQWRLAIGKQLLQWLAGSLSPLQALQALC